MKKLGGISIATIPDTQRIVLAAKNYTIYLSSSKRALYARKVQVFARKVQIISPKKSEL